MNIKRSDFIKLGSMTAVGAVAVPLLNSCANATSAVAACSGPGYDVEQRIKDLGLVFPAPPGNPNLLFHQIVVVGNMLYVSGQGPDLVGGGQITGKVGVDLTLEEGRNAARQVALTMLSSIKANLGDLNKICRLVKTLGMVNSAPDFYSSPAVINGFSQVMVDIWGEVNGRGARSSVGVASLPSNIAVEIECIFELKS